MAWVAEETFESYSDGNDINGLNGGSGWSGAWSGTGSKYYVSNAAPYQGSLSARGINSNANMDRGISSAVSSGTVYVAIRKETTNRDGSFWLRTSGSTFTICYFESDYVYVTHSGGAATLLDPFTTGQYYVLEINIISTSSFTARLHDGTSWGSLTSTLTPNNVGAVDGIRLSMGSGSAPATGTMYWDYISPTDPTAAPPAASFIPRVMFM